MSYYAHSTKKGKETWQLLIDHLSQTAIKAKEFSSKFGASDIGYLLGMVHDIGKYSKEFKRRMEGENIKTDHSTAGAKELVSKYGKSFGLLFAHIIAGHHAGLPNCIGSGNEDTDSSLTNRLNRKEYNYNNYINEVIIPTLSIDDLRREFPTPLINKMKGFSRTFFTRMLFSALVDADSLDTEAFYSKERERMRNLTPKLKDLLYKYEKYIYTLRNKTKEKSILNTLRNEILKQCESKAELEPGFFSLKAPTGSGKTIASLAFAFNHAIKHNKKRIIYVIPYMSITEQNADVFRDILGSEAILEHHSGFEYPITEFFKWGKLEKKNYLASENWDMPVVVTTSVQFFESLFSNKRSRCRKLHNLTDSVIIFDEAQLIPLDYLTPCMWGLTELVGNYKATVLFLTATLPDFNKTLPIKEMKMTEILENPQDVYLQLNRTEAEYRGNISDNKIANEMNRLEQSLCIVNTRKHASNIYKELVKDCSHEEKDNIFHLSNRMCAMHRRTTLKEIKHNLENNFPCKVISTQLVEAGVDIDFPVVYRSMTGIDSIVQGAGRNNREGKLKKGKFIIFEPEEHGMPNVGNFKKCADITRTIIRKGIDVLSLEGIDEYFKTLHYYEGGQFVKKDELFFDKKEILKFSNVDDRLYFKFKTISDKFQMIEDNTISIVIPFNDNAKNLIKELEMVAEDDCVDNNLLRNLQQYVIQIYEKEFIELANLNKITQIGKDCIWVLTSDLYDEKIGLVTLNN